MNFEQPISVGADTLPANQSQVGESGVRIRVPDSDRISDAPEAQRGFEGDFSRTLETGYAENPELQQMNEDILVFQDQLNAKARDLANLIASADSSSMLVLLDEMKSILTQRDTLIKMRDRKVEELADDEDQSAAAE